MAMRAGPDDELFQRLAEAPALVDTVIDDFGREAVLRWGDSMAELIRPLYDFAHSEEASGWVLSQDGSPRGLIVTSRRDERGRIQFLHVLPGDRGPASAAELLRRAVHDLGQAGARFIACETFLVHYADTVEQTLGELGFRAIRRMNMVAHLAEKAAETPPPAGYTLVPWEDGYLDGVAEVVQLANAGTLDALIYPAMQTAAGARGMLQSALEGNWGELDRAASTIALAAGAPCGAILLTCTAPTEGFVPEMSVSPAHQGKGLGRALFSRALAAAWEQGVRLVRLAVTEENAPAVALYRHLGFVLEDRLTAYIWRADRENG